MGLPVWKAQGGLDLGGQGTWFDERLGDCRLRISIAGLMSGISILTHEWEAHWKIGLFQNNFRPRLSMTLASIVPCDFSGYTGLQVVFSWSPPTMRGDFCVSTAHEMAWRHGGGPIGNFVFGYYILSASGDLVWAERFCPAPQAISKRGQEIRVTPLFFLTNV